MIRKEVTKPELSEIKSVKAKPQIGVFIDETKEELKKVVWPSRQQLISESIAVVLMVVLVATIISLVDHFFSWVARQPFLFG